MSDARPPRASVFARLARLAPLAALSAPLLLAGCYVVPVAPAAEPVYRPVYPKPYWHPRPYYRGPYGPYGLGGAVGGVTAEASLARPADAGTAWSAAAGDVAVSFEDAAGTAVAFAQAPELSR
jgi:hypothetical protein